MLMVDLIKKKRDGNALSKEEIDFIINGYVKGDIPDYQISALLMAIYFQKMNDEETFYLTDAMHHSGDTVDLSAIEGFKVDKHSSGGVGDKTSLVLAPMVASLGVPVAKMSGRGLGHTGGTIDKLESFPGFTTEITNEKFIETVNTVGMSIMSQTATLAPADKLLYALRDVTGTVDNISLIASSIMSKKLASGADGLVLDVTCGSGAFMKNEQEAFELAQKMVTIGNNGGIKTMAVISDMDEPLGFAIGNALEVREAIDTLKGNGPEDLVELCLTLGSYMVYFGQKASSVEEAREKLKQSLSDGSALKKFAEFIAAQGGNAEDVYDYSALKIASNSVQVYSQEDGYIKSIDSEEVGVSSLLLGGGRTSKADVIDLSVGVVLHKKIGACVKKGDCLATIYYNDENKMKTAKERLYNSFVFSKDKVDSSVLIKGIVE